MSTVLSNWTIGRSFVSRSFRPSSRILPRPPLQTPSFPDLGRCLTPNQYSSGVAVGCLNSAQRFDKSSEAIMDGSIFANVMPKEEIGASEFLKAHPNYDGRGTVIAVFDTGVDPGTKGLQITTDGLPKIVDVLDCAGSGDVDTSEIVKLDSEGFIKGVNGNLLKVNSNWHNPTNEWHVGVKPLYDLFPRGLIKRIKESRLKKFCEFQRESVTNANQALAEFNKNHPTCTEVELQKQKTELEDRIKLLESMMSKFEDTGPVLNCVVWHDGETWKAAIDTTELHEEDTSKGKLEDFTPLASFREEHQFSTFSPIDACNFVCNIFEDGNLLSIVVDGSPHGTHVAGIAAAYHPEDPSFNGIAPGARILSCKIEDNRTHGVETPVAFARAVIAAVNYGVDLVNISFGENSGFPDRGRIMELLTELVYKHRITVVTSAGNSGPGLNTLGAPAMAESMFTVGAYVSPSMAEVAHSTIETPSHGQQYTFSSRGPAPDGRTGVLFSAPGGAISNFPQWTGQSRQLANGTSMASPNGCGGLALIISALKQTGRDCNPVTIRRAIENSCLMPKDNLSSSDALQLTYGCGLLQVDRVWEYLEANKDSKHSHVRFNVQVNRSGEPNTNENNKTSSFIKACSGIYIREPKDVKNKLNYICNVTPILHEDADVKDEQLSVEMKLKLESSVDWVKCPQPFLLMHKTRSFEIEVDATGLKEDINFAEITAEEVDDPSQGCCFHIPITVINPVTSTSVIPDFDLGSFDFSPGTVIRKFMAIPDGATWAEITYTGGQFEGSRSYFIDMKYLVPDIRHDDTSYSQVIRVTKGEHYIYCMPVIGGRMFEISIGQYWSSFGESSMSIAVEFHGVTLNQGKELVLDGSVGNMRIQVSAPIRRERIKPSISLNYIWIPLAPSDSNISPYTSNRDTLSDSRVIHKLLLTYNLKLTEGGRVTPRLMMLNRQVYDSEVESQMVQIFDSNKKLLLVSDIYPSTITLRKGDYTILVLIRHDDSKLLKSLQKLTLIIERQLEKSISVPVFNTKNDSLTQSGSFREMSLYPGRMVSMVIGPLTADLPKDATTGMVLKGEIFMGQRNRGVGGALVHRSFSYIVPPTPSSASGANNSSNEVLPLPDKIEQASRDAKVKALEGYKINTDDDLKVFDSAFKVLKEEHSKHLPLLTAALKKYDNLGSLKTNERVSIIIALCDEIISCIDQVELACFIARKCPDESEKGKKRSKEATEEKEALILALEMKIRNNLKLQEETGERTIDEIRPVFEELKKWIEPTDASIAIMTAKFEGANERYASAIKALDEVVSSDKNPAGKEVYEMKIKCLEALRWTHWADHEHKQIRINFPKKYALF